MPFDAKVYKVFLASPGNLSDERQAFRETLHHYNEIHAQRRKAIFIPVGWEDTLGRLGRPQHIINQDIKSCDYFVLMLWDRWGTPPDTTGKYTSGIHEEFEVAKECCADPAMPMRDIVVFFKAVDPGKLSDPGEQLRQVLQFKMNLELHKLLLFETFDHMVYFKDRIAKHLDSWLDSKEADLVDVELHPFGATPPETATDWALFSIDTSAGTSPLIRNAERLADEGRQTEAETIFAELIVRGQDPEAFLRYGDFLMRVGRLDQALVMYTRAYELVKSQAVAGRADAVPRTLGRLGLLYKTKGDLARAEHMFEDSLKAEHILNNTRGIAEQHRNLGVIAKRRGDLDRAEQLQRKALELYVQVDDTEGIAITSGNLGIVLRKKGALEAAEQELRRSLVMSQKIDSQVGIARAYGNLGIVQQRRGELDSAQKSFEQALAANEHIGSLEGQAIQYANMGLLNEQRAALKEATTCLVRAVTLMKKVGNTPRVAKTQLQLGRIYVARVELEMAAATLTEAKENFRMCRLFDKAAETERLLADIRPVAC